MFHGVCLGRLAAVGVLKNTSRNAYFGAKAYVWECLYLLNALHIDYHWHTLETNHSSPCCGVDTSMGHITTFTPLKETYRATGHVIAMTCRSLVYSVMWEHFNYSNHYHHVR